MVIAVAAVRRVCGRCVAAHSGGDIAQCCRGALLTRRSRTCVRVCMHVRVCACMCDRLVCENHGIRVGNLQQLRCPESAVQWLHHRTHNTLAFPQPFAASFRLSPLSLLSFSLSLTHSRSLSHLLSPPIARSVVRALPRRAGTSPRAPIVATPCRRGAR